MNGYRLILNGRNVEKLNAVKKELLEKYGADVYLLPFDVRDRQAARAALESASGGMRGDRHTGEQCRTRHWGGQGT